MTGAVDPLAGIRIYLAPPFSKVALSGSGKGGFVFPFSVHNRRISKGYLSLATLGLRPLRFRTLRTETTDFTMLEGEDKLNCIGRAFGG
jgi:hypothetical protein